MATVKEIVKQNILSDSRPHSKTLKAVAAYTSTFALTILILYWVLQLWNADFSIPFSSNGDGLFGAALIKGMINNGWYLYNNYLGAPTGLYLHDYPGSDNFHFLIVKAISLFFPSYGKTYNLFFLLTFPLSAITALYMFRTLKISYFNAIGGSLLFAFLPYHFLRGEEHLFLASYYLLPIMMILLLQIISDEPPFYKLDPTTGELKLNLFQTKSIIIIISTLIFASAGIYYALFATFFALILGISISAYRNNFRHLIAATIIIALILGGIFINFLPNIVYKRANGANKEAIQRSWEGAEVYGLKISQLVMPVTGHRIATLAQKKVKYNSSAPLVNENDSASLGVIGSIGFILLIIWLILGKSLFRRLIPEKRINLLNNLSILNTSAILLSTIGGFGLIFAVTITPALRGLNRISIFIGLFSIMAIVLFLDAIKQKYFTSPRSGFIFYALISLVFVIGILDQTSPNFVPPYDQLRANYQISSKFIQTVEKTVPPQSKIFQLPYVPFPENPPVVKMLDYDHFVAYLHSDNIKWSYGAIKGREGDAWQKRTALKAPEEMVKLLQKEGFRGIYIDRFGFSDNAAVLESKLKIFLKAKPIVSEDERRSFFNITKHNATS